MPAVPADTLTLPRISPAAVDDVERPVANISTGPTGLEGMGFPVRRALAGAPYQLTDPFIMMDHLGEIDYGIGEPKGTDWHPHRGFETVTYLMDGLFQHQDSSGGGGLIEPGDTQWMTAGSGVLHIETPPASMVESGGLFNGVQIWVNLPASAKWTPPAYQGITKRDILLLTSPDAGTIIRVIAGEVTIRLLSARHAAAITVLAASRIPARLLRGVYLTDRERQARLLPWLGVHDGERWSERHERSEPACLLRLERAVEQRDEQHAAVGRERPGDHPDPPRPVHERVEEPE